MERHRACISGVVLLWAASACSAWPSPKTTTDSVEPASSSAVTAASPSAVSEPQMFGLLSQRLDRARDDWASAGVGSYRLVVAERTNHWVAGCTWTSEVADGLVVSAGVVTFDPDGMPCPPRQATVEQLHNEIAGWIEYARSHLSDQVSGEHVVAAEFDRLGVPVDMRYDLANADDEESWQSVTWSPLP